MAENRTALEAYEKEMCINDNEVSYRNMYFNRNVHQLSVFEENRRTLLKKLLDALEERFLQINSDSVLVNINMFDQLI